MYVSPSVLPLFGLPATSLPPDFRCSCQFAATAVPPLSLTTTLRTWTVGAMSLLVIVQVLSWPTVTLIAPLALQSPENVAA